MLEQAARLRQPSLSTMTTMPVRWTRMLGAPWFAARGLERGRTPRLTTTGSGLPGPGQHPGGGLPGSVTGVIDQRPCSRRAAYRPALDIEGAVGDGRSVAARLRRSRPPCRTRNVPGAQRRRRDDGRWSLVRRAAGGTCGAGSDRAVNATTYGCIVAVWRSGCRLDRDPWCARFVVGWGRLGPSRVR